MSKTVKAAPLTGSNGGFTMAVWRAEDVPVGSEVGIVAAPSVASGAQELRDNAMKAVEAWVSAEYTSTKSICAGGPTHEKALDKAEKKARAAIDSLADAIAAQAKPVEMTDAQIGDIAENYKFKEHYRSNSEAIHFARRVLANSAPNKALIEALQECSRLESAEEIRSIARDALNGAGVEV